VNWINLRAVNWAREYDTNSPAERAVLFEFALHADNRGYTWPSAVGIASRWHHDDETITGAIGALLVRRAFSRTNKRRGKTGRLIVYRLPKITWVIPRQSANSKCSQIREKSPGNYRVIPRQSATNKEQGTINNCEKRADGHSLPSPGKGPLAARIQFELDSLSSRNEAKPEPSWFEEIRGMYPGTNVDEDLRRIETWANKEKKQFTRDLAVNTLRRHPPKKPGQREGYVYHDKFVDSKQANKLAVTNLEFRLNTKRAIKYANGRIEMH